VSPGAYHPGQRSPETGAVRRDRPVDVEQVLRDLPPPERACTLETCRGAARALRGILQEPLQRGGKSGGIVGPDLDGGVTAHLGKRPGGADHDRSSERHGLERRQAESLVA